MESAPWNDKVEVIGGLLDEQLLLIDSQLQTVGNSTAGKEAIAEALNEMRELCSFTKDLVSTLPKSQPAWRRLWRSRP